MAKTPTRLDDAEIKELAKGLAEGHVFTANDCPADMIGLVFMPVGMGGLDDFDMDTVGMVAEWYSKAGERGINGYPMFLSCKVIHTEDWKAIGDLALRIAAAIEEAMG